MNACQLISASVRHVSNATHTALTPVITEAGLAAGWRFDYPAMINKGGVNFSKLGVSLDDLIALGFVRLERHLKHNPV